MFILWYDVNQSESSENVMCRPYISARIHIYGTHSVCRAWKSGGGGQRAGGIRCQLF